MQLLPGNCYRFARFQIPDPAGNLLIPGFLNSFIRNLKTVEQRIGQCGSLVSREGHCAF